MEEIHTLIPKRRKTQDSTVNYKTSDKNKWMMYYETGKDNWVEAQITQND